jgi:hypothetical protein
MIDCRLIAGRPLKIDNSRGYTQRDGRSDANRYSVTESPCMPSLGTSQHGLGVVADDAAWPKRLGWALADDGARVRPLRIKDNALQRCRLWTSMADAFGTVAASCVLCQSMDPDGGYLVVVVVVVLRRWIPRTTALAMRGFVL